MSQQGWYPDPGGSGQFRFWDGQQWSAQTSPTPGAPAPGQQPRQQSTNRSPWLVVALLVLAALVIWLVVRQFTGGGPGAVEDTNTSTPSVSAWDETSSPSAPPSSPDESGPAQQVSCPDPGPKSTDRLQNGRVTGGGLSFAPIPDWQMTGGWGVPWMNDRSGQRTTVYPGWAAIAVLGEVPKAQAAGPKAAAAQLMSCLASSEYFPDLEKRVDLSSEEVTVDGAVGWRMVAELHVPGQEVPGDVCVVTVLDTPGDHYSVFVSNASIGRDDVQAAVNNAEKTLRVER